MKCQIPPSSWNEAATKNRETLDACSSNYSDWNTDKKWSSQGWKNIRLVFEQPAGLFTQHTDRPATDDDDMDSNTVTELNLSFNSRSFLHRVNDQVRKMLDQSSKDAMQDSSKHSSIWRMFLSSTLEASVFMGKNCSDNVHSIKNIGQDLTMKQMVRHVWKSW